MAYRIIENPENISVEVEAITIEDLFSFSCHAWRDAALESADVSSTEWKFLYYKSASLQELLIQLLNELSYLLYSQDWVFNSIENLKIHEDGKEYKLYIDIYGSPFFPEDFTLRQEIKSISMDKKQIEKVEDVYKTQIIFKL